MICLYIYKYNVYYKCVCNTCTEIGLAHCGLPIALDNCACVRSSTYTIIQIALTLETHAVTRYARYSGIIYSLIEKHTL